MDPIASKVSRNASTALKSSRAWQDAQWAKWPTPALWPGKLDLYEAAAFCRVHPATIRRACVSDRNGKARLAHQRMGSSVRISKAALEQFGSVEARS